MTTLTGAAEAAYTFPAHAAAELLRPQCRTDQAVRMMELFNILTDQGSVSLSVKSAACQEAAQLLSRAECPQQPTAAQRASHQDWQTHHRLTAVQTLEDEANRLDALTSLEDSARAVRLHQEPALTTAGV